LQLLKLVNESLHELSSLGDGMIAEGKALIQVSTGFAYLGLVEGTWTKGTQTARGMLDFYDRQGALHDKGAELLDVL
jgi:hypothetical protein